MKNDSITGVSFHEQNTAVFNAVYQCDMICLAVILPVKKDKITCPWIKLRRII